MRYADHVMRQRTRLAGDALDAQLDYWGRQLERLPTLDLPLDRSRPASPSFRGDAITVELPVESLTEFRQLGRSQGASLFMLLAAAVNAVIARYTAQEDIPLGVTMLGRSDADLEDVFGLFTNMVVLRTDAWTTHRSRRWSNASWTHVSTRTKTRTLRSRRSLSARHRLAIRAETRFSRSLCSCSATVTAATRSSLLGTSTEPLTPKATRSRFDMALNFVESSSTASNWTSSTRRTCSTGGGSRRSRGTSETSLQRLSPIPRCACRNCPSSARASAERYSPRASASRGCRARSQCTRSSQGPLPPHPIRSRRCATGGS